MHQHLRFILSYTFNYELHEFHEPTVDDRRESQFAALTYPFYLISIIRLITAFLVGLRQVS